MNILMISHQEMLVHTYMLYGRNVLGARVNFITMSEHADNEDKKIDAVLIDVHNQAKPFIRRRIVQYSAYPVFLIGRDGKGHEKNILGEFIGNVSIRDVIKSIKMTLNLDSVGKGNNAAQIQIGYKERSILECLALGYSNKEIARDFDLNISTVKYYIRLLYKKLNVRNRAQAALIAREIIV